ncbi:MAG: hypothetical protein LBT44_03465 [Clostridiales bacterium]|jgi:hypothetical protein|nr:hypothetical protein [Clostridiales bacterium]
MKIIRTAAVELSAIPAIAYKQKLTSGGAGLKLLRLDQEASAAYTINRRDGLAAAYGPADESLFPDAAVDEALELTEGLPYASRGKIKVTLCPESAEPQELETPETEEAGGSMVDTDEYRAIASRYIDEKGKMNYRLMNKDFMQFASKSKIVADLAAQKTGEDEIIAHILKNRAAYLAEKKDSLDDRQIRALMDTLEEIDPRSAFKELRRHIRRMLARK